jgi:hypothetical protein
MQGFAPLGGAPLGAPGPSAAGSSGGGGGGGGTSGHRYWRVVWDTTDRGSAGCAKLEFHTSIGGADISGTGTAMCSSSYAGDQGQPAFDNDITSNWSSDFGQLNGWLGMDFGAGNSPAVVEIALTPRQDGSFTDSDSPKPGGLEYSDDNATWTRLFSFSRPTYAKSTVYTFNVNSAGQVIADALTVTDAADATIYSLNAVLSDGFSVASALSPQWKARIRLAELLTAGDVTYQGAQQYNYVTAEASDTARIGMVGDAARGRLGVVVETLQVADALTGLYGVILTEQLQLGNVLGSRTIYHPFLAEAIRLADNVRNGLPVALTDGVGLTSLLDAKTAIRLVEALRVADSLGGGAAYQVRLAERLRLADNLKRFFGAELTDTVGVANLLTALRMTSNVLVDGIQVADTLAPRLLIAVSAAERVTIDAELAVRALFNPTLVDGIEITGGYLEPNGAFTAWSMNTRTGAVTEYGDFAFNSFAALGYRYLGASPDGLYELVGETDDGDDIIADIAGGYMQFGGTQLSRLKEAYLATIGEGRFVLKIVTADGGTYSYGVDARSGRNTKVHMGKGMRARYFAWELTSTGQNFDLDTLEFVPLVVQRRV